jgi:hypothetical protein
VPAASREELAELIADCHDDPGLFHEAVLGRLPLHPKQEEIARSVVESRVTVVPAAHAVGKSWYAGTAALHWLYTRPGGKVVTTSASNTQLVTVLWGAIKAAHANSRIPLKGRVSEGNAIPQRLELGPEWYAIGWSAKRPESFSGIHGGEILVVVDESSGVEDAIFDAIESLGYESLLLLGNPIRAGGHFRTLYDMAAAGEPGYRGIHLTAFDSPHAGLTDDEVRSLGLPRGLTTRTWIERIRRIYGESSLYWRTRVLALFPDEDHDQLIPTAWVDRSREASRADGFAGPRILSIDLAKGTGRDRTVFLVGDSLGLVELEATSDVDLRDAAARARQKASRWGIRAENVVYDAGGWAGPDFGRYLEASGLNGATPYLGSGSGGKRFRNRRSRAAWALRQRLDPDRQRLHEPPNQPLPDHAYPAIARATPDRPKPPRATVQPPFSMPGSVVGEHWIELREELTAIRYRHDGPKLELEPKDDLMARLGRSPDLADAMIMLASLWGVE